jgi:TolB-like protein/class 3 adenylate cyclase/Tfp pilus assembly protein PilF
MERRLAAVLIADVVGYSRLTEADEELTRTSFQADLEEIFLPNISKHHGRLVKTMGDGLLVVFPSAVAAVQCAVDIQRILAGRSEATSPSGLTYRIGINLGDIIMEGEDIQGHGVNVTERLQGMADPGGIIISGTTYDQVKANPSVGYANLGEQPLKNILDPVRVYRVLMEPEAAGKTIEAPQIVKKPIATDKPAIAVLPFGSIGADPSAARLADGLTEEIITDLSRFRGLDVIARNSTAVYKNSSVDVRQMGRVLNVRYVLQGSIQWMAGHVRVTAQLIDASTGTNLWSHRWDRPDRDIFSVQAEVAEQVAVTLGGMAGSAAITSEEMRKARRRSPNDLTAYDHYLLANHGRTQFTRESVSQGIEHATTALALDPNLGRAYVARAWLNYITVHYGAEPDAANNAMESDSRRAVALDPYDAEARGALAFCLSNQGSFKEAEAQLNLALQANPTNTQVLVNATQVLSSGGQPEKAAEFADKVLRLDPWMTPEALNGIKDAYFFARRFEDVVAVVTRIPQEARGRGSRLLLVLSYALLGNEREMVRARNELLANYPTMSAELLMNQEWVFARTQEEELFIEGFRAANLPLCASDAELSHFPKPKRLPECTKPDVSSG